MATHAHSTTAPALQPRLLPLVPFTFRSARDQLSGKSGALPTPPVDDPRSADELLEEIRRTIEGQVARPELPTEPLLPAPAPLPSLTSALSRRATLFGAVAATGALAGSAALATVPAGLSSNDARLVTVAAELLDVDMLIDALDVGAPGYDALIERYRPLEIEMENTPSDTMVGVLAEARALQIKAVAWCQNEIGNSIANDLCRLHGGAHV